MSTLPPGERDAIVHRVRVACELADAPALRSLLTPDVVALVDSGGDLPVATHPVAGAGPVADTVLAALAGAGVTEQQVNGVCALVARRAGRVVGIVSLEISDGAVARVWITLSPLKLRRWNS